MQFAGIQKSSNRLYNQPDYINGTPMILSVLHSWISLDQVMIETVLHDRQALLNASPASEIQLNFPEIMWKKYFVIALLWYI